MRKNGLNNRHGDFCESGIRACPESVGVGKFCRLRLRLREKQPTPTDSDSGSDSDSAALQIPTVIGTSRNPTMKSAKAGLRGVPFLNIRSRSSDVIVLLSHCTSRCSYIMMPYHLVALSSKFSRSLKDTSYDVTSPISDWKLKLKFLSSYAIFPGKRHRRAR